MYISYTIVLVSFRFGTQSQRYNYLVEISSVDCVLQDVATLWFMEITFLFYVIINLIMLVDKVFNW